MKKIMKLLHENIFCIMTDRLTDQVSCIQDAIGKGYPKYQQRI